MKIDIILIYYDNPVLLNNLLYRMFFYTDYIKYKKYLKFIIADSGTPKENIDKTLEVVDRWKDKIDIIYFWCETSEIRKEAIDKGLLDRPSPFAQNIAAKDISTADVLLFSVIGMVYTPTYFENVFLIHMKDKKAFLQPRRYDLEDFDYHDKHFNIPFEKLDMKKRVGGGGFPDVSLRREYYLDVGGQDERFIIPWATDMDFSVRMTAKMDNGSSCFMYFPNQPYFKDYGLNFIQPSKEDFFSLTCNLYKGHVHKSDRKSSIEYGNELFLNSWGIIKRNENSKYKVDYEILRG